MQQMGVLVADAFTTDSYVGKAASVVEQFGEATAQQRTTRHADTPLLDLSQDKRWVFPLDYEWASLVDNVDKLRLRIEPTGAYTQAAAAGMNRAKDDVAIAAFFATAFKGENGTTQDTFDTTNYQVGHDVGGTASSLNVAKLQSALTKFIFAAKGDVMEQLFTAIGRFEHDALLKEIQVVNKDYNGGAAVLEAGRVRRFMGFDFRITERLQTNGTDRLIPAWRKSGMHLGVWQDLMARISERNDKGHSWQVYTCMTIGATRLESGKVVQILCDDQI
jgi:hypothetical protein